MKVVADTLGVARSNLVEQVRGTPKPRGRYQRQGDVELLTAIRQLTDARPTYGYRRITALLNRARRASGAEPLNHKRIYRLMLQGGLLLQRHGTRRPIRAHEGTVIAPASNLRWSSDGLEIPCWDAAQHDSRSFPALLDPGNTASRVWADTAYRTKRNLKVLERRGLSERIQFRRAPRRGLSEQQAKANAARVRVRSGIEHVFAAQKHRMALFVRTIGLARAQVKIGIANLAYNFTRLAWLSTRAAPA